jgi:NAD-dependent DNA ligase
MKIKNVFSDLLERDLKMGEKVFQLHAKMKQLEVEKDNKKREELAKQIDDLEKECKEFKPEVVQNMFKNFKIKESLQERNLEDKGVFSKKIGTSNKLDGLSFCITGPLEKALRTEYIKIIQDNGGEYFPMVKDGLDYLVTNDKNSGSRKNILAQKFKIEVINEGGLLALLNKKGIK